METPALFTGVRENFRFLLLEVKRQLEETLRMIREPSDERSRRVFERDDYIDNLRSVIENKCFALLCDESIEKPKQTVDLLRAVTTSVSNLERIADFAANIVGQQRYLHDRDVLLGFPLEPFFQIVIDATQIMDQALFGRDMSLALKLCRAEVDIDDRYDASFGEILGRLRAGQAPEDLITTLFVLRYLERMGDSLLNIGEAVIFATAGEKLKISQYQALAESLSDIDLHIEDVDYEGIWESKSGARIGALHSRRSDEEGPRWIIFKEGRKQKLLEEKEGLEQWEALMPGLPPRVFAYHEHGEMASLLLEFLQGETLQKMLLKGDRALLRRAWRSALTTISTVWRETFELTPSAARFVSQMRKRVGDVSKVHPDFSGDTQWIGDARVAPLLELMDRAAPLDAILIAPFSVRIHGDFNTDNLIFNPADDTIHFIDLHRSKMSDYVQDISVFLVSNFRTPVFEAGPRSRLNACSLDFLTFSREFAVQRGDETFAARLALGLSRSFFTSTRFQIDPEFVQTMLSRSRYLLERLVAWHEDGHPWHAFEFEPSVVTL